MDGDTILYFDNPQAYSLELDLVVHVPNIHHYPPILNIVNYLNGKTKAVVIEGESPANYYIDACYFEENELIVIFSGFNGKGYEERDLQIRRIPIQLE